MLCDDLNPQRKCFYFGAYKLEVAVRPRDPEFSLKSLLGPRNQPDRSSSLISVTRPAKTSAVSMATGIKGQPSARLWPFWMSFCDIRLLSTSDLKSVCDYLFPEMVVVKSCWLCCFINLSQRRVFCLSGHSRAGQSENEYCATCTVSAKCEFRVKVVGRSKIARLLLIFRLNKCCFFLF